MVGYRNPVRGAWESADATFGMVFSNPAPSPPAMNLYEIAATLDHGNIASIPVQFVTSASVTQDCPECFGDYWVRANVIDPVILYLNPTNDELGPAVRYDPSRFLVEYSGPTGVGGTYLFRFQSQSEGVTQVEPSICLHRRRSSRGQLFSPVAADRWMVLRHPPPTGMKVFSFVCPVFDNVACH
jgi:hypothetical protein